MKHYFYLLLIYIMCTGCISEDYPTGTAPIDTFESLWRTLDERYCFFDYKDVDWQEVHTRYRAKIQNNMSDDELLSVLTDLTYELRDGHVNLITPKNVSRYGAWYDNFPTNFSDSLLRKTLGRAEEYRQVGSLAYRVLPDYNYGYVRVSSFEGGFSLSVISEMLYSFKDCPALIIDLRSNGGGLLTAAETLASSFIDKRTKVGYMQYKTGRGHSDFSEPKPIYIDPSKGGRWLRPVILLTNRRTYSAANSFVMYMQPLPHVLVVGDRTGGGSGMPYSSELPNGWGVRFSASPMLNLDREHTEFGIEPNVHQDIPSLDYARGKDTILERACNILRDFFKQQEEGK